MKGILEEFIKKYHLNGINEVAVFRTSNGMTATDVENESGTLISTVGWQGSLFADGEIGFYNTNQFLKLLSLYDDDDNFKMSFNETVDGFDRVYLQGSNSAKSEYIPADISIIKQPNKPKESKITWDISCELSAQDVDIFIKSRRALSDAAHFFVDYNPKQNSPIFFIGNTEYGTNKITLGFKNYSILNTMQGLVKFDLDILFEIVSELNSDVKIRVSSAGIMRIDWASEDGNLKCRYYLSAVQ